MVNKRVVELQVGFPAIDNSTSHSPCISIGSMQREAIRKLTKGQFTRYNFVACDMFTTSLRHESFRVNETYNLLTIVVYDTKNVVGFWNMFFPWREQRTL